MLTGDVQPIVEKVTKDGGMQALMQLGIVDQDYKVVNESALPGITDLVNEKAAGSSKYMTFTIRT